MSPLLAISKLLLVALAAAPQAGGDGRAEELRTRVDVLLLSHDAREAAGRLELARELYDLGPDATAYLCKLLKRGDIAGAAIEPAALVVGKHARLSSLSALIRLARSEDPETRRAGLAALCLSNRREAIPVLVRAVGDPVPSVADLAESSLMKMSVPRRDLVRGITRNFELSRNRPRLSRVLAEIGGDEAHSALIECLDLDPEAAMQGLQQLGDARDGVYVLRILERSLSNSVRKQASLCLGHLGYEAAIPELIELLDAEDLGLAANAHWGLQRITGQKLKRDHGLWLDWWELVGSKRDV